MDDWVEFVVCCADRDFVANVRVRSSEESDRWAVAVTTQQGVTSIMTGCGDSRACDYLRDWMSAVNQGGMRETG